MNEELVAEMVLGAEAEKFLGSNLGKYLVGCAEQEAQAAMAKLKATLPTDAESIRELQNEIWRAEQFKVWLMELIEAGHQADQTLREEED